MRGIVVLAVVVEREGRVVGEARVVKNSCCKIVQRFRGIDLCCNNALSDRLRIRATIFMPRLRPPSARRILST